MKYNINKLSPFTVGLSKPEDRGGNLDIKCDEEVFVVKNCGGKYYGPYKVSAKSDIVRESTSTYGFLALVNTSVDDYFDAITDMDVIAYTEEAVIKLCNALLDKQDKKKRERKEFFNNFKL